MRLDPHQRQTILETSHRFLGEDATVLLFGSRVDDAAKGGDVDLYIETPQPPGIWRQAQLLAELEKQLGLSVDLVLHAQGEPEKPIHRIAKLTGVALL
ncbi:MAG: nucleotidyltransferase domain-containing protein [Sulfuricellaceae bacterium]